MNDTSNTNTTEELKFTIDDSVAEKASDDAAAPAPSAKIEIGDTPSVTEANSAQSESILNDDISSDAEDTAILLHDMVKSASKEAKLERLAMPSRKTARLAYSAYSDMRPAKSSAYAPASIGTYFWLLILTSIPAIGFIAAAIFAFASKKLAIKRFTTAVLFVQVLALLIAAILVCIAVFVWKLDPIGYFNEIAPLLEQCIDALK